MDEDLCTKFDRTIAPNKIWVVAEYPEKVSWVEIQTKEYYPLASLEFSSTFDDVYCRGRTVASIPSAMKKLEFCAYTDKDAKFTTREKIPDLVGLDLTIDEVLSMIEE